MQTSPSATRATNPAEGGPKLSRREMFRCLGAALSLAFADPASLLKESLAPLAPEFAKDLTAIANTLWPRTGKYGKIAMRAPALRHFEDLAHRLENPYWGSDPLWNQASFDAEVACDLAWLCDLHNEQLLPGAGTISMLHDLLCPEDRYFKPGETARLDGEGHAFAYLPVFWQGLPDEENLRLFLGHEPSDSDRTRWEQLKAEVKGLFAECQADDNWHNFQTSHQGHEEALGRRNVQSGIEEAARLRSLGREDEAKRWDQVAEDWTGFTSAADETFAQLRAYVRTIYWMTRQRLPEVLVGAEKAGTLPPSARTLEPLKQLVTEGFKSLASLDIERLRALSQYSHQAADLLRAGPEYRPLCREAEERFQKCKEELDALGIDRDARLERSVENPCRSLELANFSSRVAARARSSEVTVSPPSGADSSRTIVWQEQSAQRCQPLPECDQKHLSAAGLFEELLFPRGLAAAEVEELINSIAH